MKVRFTEDSERISDFKSRIALILADQSLDDTERKRQVNKVRRDCMLKYSFYSPERAEIDHFIRYELDRQHMRQWKEHQSADTVPC